jgi:phospholipid/cholesterol/gamma-HCH transport system permease protein
MATVDIPPKVPRRLVTVANQPLDGLAMLGQQLAFYIRVLAWVPRTLAHT